MSLDFDLCNAGATVYSNNITHNLGAMADAAGIYVALWRTEFFGKPDALDESRRLRDAGDWTRLRELEGEAEKHPPRAGDLIETLRAGLADLRSRPEHFETFAPYGYSHFVWFVDDVLRACIEHPDAFAMSSR